MLSANKILQILRIFIKPNIWYSWSLKILAIKRVFPFNLTKTLQGHHFVVGGPKSFKLLADIFLRTAFKILYCRVCCYFCVLVDLDNIQWTEVATSTARNFKNSWPIYVKLPNMINLFPNIWFIKNSKCQNLFFEKGAAKIFFHIFKGLLFRHGWPY